VSRAAGSRDLKRTLRYVRGTLDRGIKYHANITSCYPGYQLRNKLVAAVDSNFFHNGDKAISGSVCMLNGGAVSWRSSRQATITTSSTHAEVTAAAEFSQTVLWMRNLLNELGHAQPTTRVIVDNKAVCDQSISGQELRKAEHYRIKQVWLEQCVRNRELWLDHTAGDDNFADAMTKATSANTFRKHRKVFSGEEPVIPLSREIVKILDLGRAKYVTGSSSEESELPRGGCWKMKLNPSIKGQESSQDHKPG
jgi:hypothetical protein